MELTHRYNGGFVCWSQPTPPLSFQDVMPESCEHPPLEKKTTKHTEKFKNADKTHLRVHFCSSWISITSLYFLLSFSFFPLHPLPWFVFLFSQFHRDSQNAYKTAMNMKETVSAGQKDGSSGRRFNSINSFSKKSRWQIYPLTWNARKNGQKGENAYKHGNFPCI